MSHPPPQATWGSAALLRLLDARVRGDGREGPWEGTLCVGVPTADGPLWWVAELGRHPVRTRFSRVRPESFRVAVALDERGARRLLGLPADVQQAGDEPTKPLELVSGEPALLETFSQWYLAPRRGRMNGAGSPRIAAR